ncbi:hypothetical protein, partial [Klebsiella pneumoniae]|uniref:hypothetical protein n=1 Tax=Klebsiella pneumoniae TaxID=573 RepID=UPI0022BA0FA1
RENPRYLAGIKLSPTLKVQADFPVAARHALGQADALWVLGTPMGALRQTLLQLLEIAPIEQWPPLVWLCKGFEVGTSQMPHQVVEEVLGKPY